MFTTWNVLLVSFAEENLTPVTNFISWKTRNYFARWITKLRNQKVRLNILNGYTLYFLDKQSIPFKIVFTVSISSRILPDNPLLKVVLLIITVSYDIKF